jgi:hypothetical protein
VRRFLLRSECGWSLGAARGSTRLLKKEMKGPQGLGDSGAEASNEARGVRGPRVSELLLSAFADRPPYRRTLGAASRVSSDVQQRLSDVQRFAQKTWLQGSGRGCESPACAHRQLRPTVIPGVIVADECTNVNTCFGQAEKSDWCLDAVVWQQIIAAVLGELHESKSLIVSFAAEWVLSEECVAGKVFGLAPVIEEKPACTYLETTK